MSDRAVREGIEAVSARLREVRAQLDEARSPTGGAERLRELLPKVQGLRERRAQLEAAVARAKARCEVLEQELAADRAALKACRVIGWHFDFAQCERGFTVRGEPVEPPFIDTS